MNSKQAALFRRYFFNVDIKQFAIYFGYQGKFVLLSLKFKSIFYECDLKTITYNVKVNGF